MRHEGSKDTKTDTKNSDWNDRLRLNLLRRTGLFVLVFLVVFALLVLLNGFHLGVNAALHWDAAASAGGVRAMPSREMLADARAHIDDAREMAGSDDPAAVTMFYISPEGAKYHQPLENLRRYYSQLSFRVARESIEIGGRITGSPTGAVIIFQLTAAALMASALSLLTVFSIVTMAPGPGAKHRLVTIAITLVTIASQPIVLSLSRQVLTEPVGFALMVPGLLLLTAALSPGRRWWIAAGCAAVAGVFLFGAIRARYNLSVTIGLLLPLIVLSTVPMSELCRRRNRYFSLFGTVFLVFSLLVGIDTFQYGPMLMPWVYQATLVHTAGLYFHSFHPVEVFLVLLFLNGPLLLLPVLIGFCRVVGPRENEPRMERARAVSGSGAQVRLLRGYAPCAAVFCLVTLFTVVAFLTWRMEKQEVAYQPRHLFPFSAVMICVAIPMVGRVRWWWISSIFYRTICAIVIMANLYSTLVPQRTRMTTPWPAEVVEILDQRSTDAAAGKPVASLPVALLDGYFDWSDNDRLHDILLTLQYVNQHGGPAGNPMLVVDNDVLYAEGYTGFCRQFKIATAWWIPDPAGERIYSNSDHQCVTLIQQAQAAGRWVYVIASKAGPLAAIPGQRMEATDLKLEVGTLNRVEPLEQQ